jgi:hypothetical protein
MAPRPYPVDMFWDKAMYDVEGNYLGQIEAVAWGRDGVSRRVGVRCRPDTDGLRFFVVDEANYVGEQTLGYLSQVVAVMANMFLSMAVGLAVAVALIRGFARRAAATVGNFWIDATRAILEQGPA